MLPKLRGEPELQQALLNILTQLAAGYGDFAELDKALAYAKEALDVARQMKSSYDEAVVRVTLGNIYRLGGEIADARRSIEGRDNDSRRCAIPSREPYNTLATLITTSGRSAPARVPSRDDGCERVVCDGRLRRAACYSLRARRPMMHMVKTLIALTAVAACSQFLAAHAETRQASAAAAPRIKACSLVPKEEVKKHLPWNAVVDRMEPEEEAIGASGSSCNYPSVFIQVLPRGKMAWPPSQNAWLRTIQRHR